MSEVQTTFGNLKMAEWQYEAHDKKKLNEGYCIQCNRAVPNHEYDWKYIGVGGFLTGPFCGESCQWEWLLDG